MDPLMRRRTFASWSASLSFAALLGARLGCNGALAAGQDQGSGDGDDSVAIATWDFGLEPCRIARERMLAGGHRLDAVEAGIRHAESDVNNRSVGIGGIPNADGVVQLDASIMDGDRQRAGAVGALEGFAHPISVARLVMEKTPHVMLVGAGAAAFATEQQCEQVELLTDRELKAFHDWKRLNTKPEGGVDPVNPKGASQKSTDNHDTIGLLVKTAAGDLAGGCSTSGWGYKKAGRLGDSPIIAGGLYVDGSVGAAAATGLGELTMRYAGSFLVVEAMRRGASPEEACIEAIGRIVAGERRQASELSINFIAIDKQGRVGGAGTDEGFVYALANKDHLVLQRPSLIR